MARPDNPRTTLIPRPIYKGILKHVPILCVDLIIKNDSGNFLLLKRANEPLRGEWWVPGGRVLKGESILCAVIRKSTEETGLFHNKVHPVGYYEEVFDRCAFGRQSVHTTSIVYEMLCSNGAKIRIDHQSSYYKWADQLPERFEKNLTRFAPQA